MRVVWSGAGYSGQGKEKTIDGSLREGKWDGVGYKTLEYQADESTLYLGSKGNS